MLFSKTSSVVTIEASVVTIEGVEATSVVFASASSAPASAPASASL